MPTVTVQTLRRGRPYAERVLAELQKAFPELGFSIDPMNGGDAVFALKVSGGNELTTVDVEKVTNHVNLIPFTEPGTPAPAESKPAPAPAPQTRPELDQTAKLPESAQVDAPGLDTRSSAENH